MKRVYINRLIILIISLVLFSGPTNIFAQEQEEIPIWKKMRYLSEEEMYLPVERGQFNPTDPPIPPVVNVAEFDHMEGVLVKYPLGIPIALIAEMSEDVMVTTIVANEAQEAAATNQYIANGVNMDNCDFLIAASESHWTRDYGPWYVIDGNYEVGIVNFLYNRPKRPNDNQIPAKMAEFLDVPLFYMDLETAGGNYMTDGYGISSSTDLIWDENLPLSPEEIETLLFEYCGINTYHVLPDPLGDYIKHIDCWGKFLSVNKVLIGQVPENHDRYEYFEDVADYFENQLCAWGMPYEVIRIFTPGDYPYTPYTNSLILNNKVLIPVTGSQWDDEALDVYEAAMPGYEIIGVSDAGSNNWVNTDALHCRTKGVADRGMLWIHHLPLWGNLPSQTEYSVEATIVPLSAQPLYPDSVLVYYKIDNGSYMSVVMTTENDTNYVGVIPVVPDSDIEYYIHAADQSGRSANHPYIGRPDPHEFHVNQEYKPNIAISKDEIITACQAGSSVVDTFQISNSGNIQLDYEITPSIVLHEDYDFPIGDSPDGNSYNYNTFDELGWTELIVDQNGEVYNWRISFTWYTPVPGMTNFGSFWVQSPSGTIAAILNGGTINGDVIKELDDFNGEPMMGTWKIWIEDGNGEGGHEASNIVNTIARTVELDPWLSVTPESGTIVPNNENDIHVISDASQLDAGMYSGDLLISSNDPDEPEIIIPVTFNVETLPDITVIPESITFLDYQQMVDGIPIMVYNLSESNVMIENINELGSLFLWYIDPWGINLPYEITSGDSLELNVKVDLPVFVPGEIITDTMFIETPVTTHTVLINIDSDLISSVNKNSSFTTISNYPNPFGNSTTINFSMRKSNTVVIEIYNHHGQKIRSLINRSFPEGNHQIEWNGRNDWGKSVSSGIYFYRISSENDYAVKKMLLIR